MGIDTMNVDTALASNISAELEVAHERYRDANPRSYQQHRKAAEVLPGGNTRTVLYSDPFPITLASADGCRVTSLDGNEYVDYLGEFTAGLYGHSNPLLREAVESALQSGWVRGGHIEQEEKLARLICDRFPSIERIRFTNSGTEATLYAISALRAISGRNKVLVFEGAYHGGVFVFKTIQNPLNAPFDFVVAPYNDWEGTRALLEANAAALSCVLIEPMQGSGGCIPASPSFLRQLRSWTEQNAVTLIFDEVMTSRLSGGGLQQMHGITPDITTLGKYIGAGFSFGAFGGREDLMSQFDPSRAGAFSHAGTFNNNVFTMTAGAVGLEKVFTPIVAEQLTERGNCLRERLNRIAAKASFHMQFTGVGSLMNVHMCAGEINSVRDLAQSDMNLRDLFYFDLLERGIWPARRGMLNLSLPMGEPEFRVLVDAVSDFVQVRSKLL